MKKLRLSRETLRTLTLRAELAGVVGGTNPPSGMSCPDANTYFPGQITYSCPTWGPANEN